MLNATVCTLCEKDYHYGVGVLTNSLYQRGFRGVMWVGYRGKLPSWAESGEAVKNYHELSIGEGCLIRFVELDTPKHFAFYKPDFMWQILQQYAPEVDAVFYFDPDIVNKAHWNFYQRWVQRGIAICGDCWYLVAANDPRRLAWQEFAESQGFTCQRDLEYHYNSGFIGVHRNHRDFLTLWQKLIETGDKQKISDLSLFDYDDYTDGYPYLYSDQTYMNLALMLSTEPLSTIGPEGMDFLPGGTIMSHAIAPNVKPWRKKFIRSVLDGSAPTITDKLYWQNSQTPIQLYSSIKHKQQQLALLIASAIGRFIRRPVM
ncbi:hypothetical protein [Calothrix sp. UHCC 0171]|uniref:hypothetical protein n=1 Tax=Calothrix sp. UHCC 0171 TaxID=3110245 RepID=UPI002B1F0599|nr:hypothetical protein [Calothrix sp. UHCC 0171]MEA5573043.1 hypothetical protein [Calothrix sp. UHCC 0171]